ncbi:MULTISPECIES: hypothetical protein [Azotobacter]|uniref:hypothetical protein n=1 Tax=Azotobacter TaxID=352 RepID=UPI0009310CDC|nr:hypothetical protein [Azotobacter vinelandii]
MMLYLVVTNGPEVAPVLKRPAILEKAVGQVNFQPAAWPRGVSGAQEDPCPAFGWVRVLWKKHPQINRNEEFLKRWFFLY